VEGDEAPPTVPDEEIIDELTHAMGTMSTDQVDPRKVEQERGIKDVLPDGDDEPITFG